MIRAINVSQIGLRIRSPIILLFRKYSSLWIRTRNSSAEIASLQRNRQCDEDNDGVAYEVADDRHEAAKKSDRNEQRRVRHVNGERKIAVNTVLMSEIVICAPMTVAKLR